MLTSLEKINELHAKVASLLGTNIAPSQLSNYDTDTVNKYSDIKSVVSEFKLIVDSYCIKGSDYNQNNHLNNI